MEAGRRRSGIDLIPLRTLSDLYLEAAGELPAAFFLFAQNAFNLAESLARAASDIVLLEDFPLAAVLPAGFAVALVAGVVFAADAAGFLAALIFAQRA